MTSSGPEIFCSGETGGDGNWLNFWYESVDFAIVGGEDREKDSYGVASGGEIRLLIDMVLEVVDSMIDDRLIAVKVFGMD